MALFALCSICGGDDLQGGEDGYFYCSACGSQSQQYQEQLLDFEAMAGYTKRTHRSVAAPEEGATGIAAPAHEADPHLPSLQNPLFSRVGFTDNSSLWETPAATWAPSNTPAQQPPQLVDPMGTIDVDSATIRTLYIEGLQHIVQLQCESLVQNFQVSPLICGVFVPIWLRFVAFTHVLEKDWGREVLQVEEARDEKRKMNSNKKKKDMQQDEEGSEDRTVQMRMALRFIWLNALKERIPLATSLAIIYLACHIVGEAILPTDIVQWASKGSLPYLAAFCEVEKKRDGLAWPIEARLMFKPVDVVGARKLEFMAASIAKRIGLQLPSVNFSSISHRLLKELNLPVEELSTFVHRLYDWYRPPGLYLSDEPHALPSRVYVMAMVMITLKVLYKIDGRLYGETHEKGCGKGVRSPSDRAKQEDQLTHVWKSTMEKDASQDFALWLSPVVNDNMEIYMSKTTQQVESPQDPHNIWNAHFLLEKLEKSWEDHTDKPFDCEKDLSCYLKYCQNFVFSGLKLNDREEDICKRLWQLYEKPPNKDDAVSQKKPFVPHIPEVQSLSEDSHFSFPSFPAPGPQREEATTALEHSNSIAENSPGIRLDNQVQLENHHKVCRKFPSLEKLVPVMESLGFACLPPRKKPLMARKYLRYVRKKAKGGNALQFVHADYFMVLCACANIIKVHPVALHWCIQRVEKPLIAIKEKARDFQN